MLPAWPRSSRAIRKAQADGTLVETAWRTRAWSSTPPQRHRPRFDVVTDTRFYFDREGTGGRADLQPERLEVGGEPPSLPAAAAGGTPCLTSGSARITVRSKVDKVGDRRAYAVQFHPRRGAIAPTADGLIDAESCKLKVRSVRRS